MFPSQLKDIIKGTWIGEVAQRFLDARSFKKWIQSGKPVPPPHVVKRMAVFEYAEKFGTRVFIETGTFKGDMVRGVMDVFDVVHSIELNKTLCEQARRKFSLNEHVTIWQGDSAVILPKLIEKISTPCLFWLDGHYSGGVTASGLKETPIIEEIAAILRHPIKNHVVLIDDARCFDEEQDYPRIDELRAFVESQNSSYRVVVADDIIRIHV